MRSQAMRHCVLHAKTEMSNPMELLPQRQISRCKVMRERVASGAVWANKLRRHEKLIREFTNPMALDDVRVLSDVDPSFGFSFEARD